MLSLATPLVGAASAQDSHYDVALGLGSGITRGGGDALATGHMTPLFIDASVRTTPAELRNLLLGGSLRVELERTGGIALVPRAELRCPVGGIEVRPGVAFPVFFTPNTMLGPEVSVGLHLPLTKPLAFVAMGSVSAFFFGSDVPEGTTVVMFNLLGAISMEI